MRQANIYNRSTFNFNAILVPCINLTSAVLEKNLTECYLTLNIPINSKQDVVRSAFVELAKKYHPDSGSPEASIDKFCAIDKAFRVLTKHNTRASSTIEMEKIVFDIKHTAPQHRQYLSFEGIGHGTPAQRMKQWTQAQAQRAAENVMEHRVAKAVASDNNLMKKGEYSKKHDIKTKYGFDRLVEDLIQESISKGEFNNLSGTGKPLRDQSRNPYVDFTTHKLNEVLINNGFTPEWITMNKDIEQEVESFKEGIRSERTQLGPYPLSAEDDIKWAKICKSNKDIAKSINLKINTFNLIVPLINKQKFHIDFEKICEDILENGKSSVMAETVPIVKEAVREVPDRNVDLMALFFKSICEMFTDLTKNSSVTHHKKDSGQ